jgi:hypothetical protein
MKAVGAVHPVEVCEHEFGWRTLDLTSTEKISLATVATASAVTIAAAAIVITPVAAVSAAVSGRGFRGFRPPAAFYL